MQRLGLDRADLLDLDADLVPQVPGDRREENAAEAGKTRAAEYVDARGGGLDQSDGLDGRQIGPPPEGACTLVRIAGTGLTVVIGAVQAARSRFGGVGQGGRWLATDHRRGLVHQRVVRERLHHEQREVDAPHQVAREDGIAHPAAPMTQTFMTTP